MIRVFRVNGTTLTHSISQNITVVISFCHKAVTTSRAVQQLQDASGWHIANYSHVTKAPRLIPKVLTNISLDFYAVHKRIF